ncbi:MULTISPECIES: hypothetical protein [Citrobacter]|uniref:hypothetical protein n=1 Tax=Citrobacter TaxID=544 RepID=UPI001BCF28E6|nr:MULTISPECIES: hypothetical protein [Citrobacter freundii complex]MCS0534244.1 hypothetical protein [Citrobacter portucalensis]
MKAKNNSTIHIVLLSLLASLVLNYYVSVKYKDEIITEFTAQAYYQFLTWLSLAQPVIIGVIYTKCRRRYYLIKRWLFLRRHGQKINPDNLSPKHKKMFEAVSSFEIASNKDLVDIYSELHDEED